MYLQLTTRCNKKCGHCCYSCSEEGEDMTKEVFVAGCKLFENDFISLGGGEPTLHPLFWEFIGIALRYCEESPGSVWLATNGSIVNDTLKLARLARSGMIGVALSVDKYHGHVDPEVVKAFTRQTESRCGYEKQEPYDLREIRSIEQPLAFGRAAKWGELGRCICDDVLVRPSGEIFACGCLTIGLGTVFAPKVPRNFERGCHGAEQAKRKARAA